MVEQMDYSEFNWEHVDVKEDDGTIIDRFFLARRVGATSAAILPSAMVSEVRPGVWLTTTYPDPNAAHTETISDTLFEALRVGEAYIRSFAKPEPVNQPFLFGEWNHIFDEEDVTDEWPVTPGEDGISADGTRWLKEEYLLLRPDSLLIAYIKATDGGKFVLETNLNTGHEAPRYQRVETVFDSVFDAMGAGEAWMAPYRA
ncbi:hypothetical protein [Aeromicrobium sp. 179-A 4D2 NHS]|uniref:hypothetical protein n=1 Tax=Aeromicrobium sp. 179-A 4D2 NHS TaxID=3142375 RepID=UPI0039A356F9